SSSNTFDHSAKGPTLRSFLFNGFRKGSPFLPCIEDHKGNALFTGVTTMSAVNHLWQYLSCF
ncbi:hypothetical protein, partial [Serratia quinivorans]|uniref:hypothetical protein n=1 Tax=Serratia quinivorans TaxID=137545 RepID=UPI003F6F3027